MTDLTKKDRVLKLAQEGMSQAAITEYLGVSRNVVAGYICRLRRAGLLDASTKEPTRADDERLLAGIRARKRGRSWADAASLTDYRSWKMLQRDVLDVIAHDARAEGVPIARLEAEYGL